MNRKNYSNKWYHDFCLRLINPGKALEELKRIIEIAAEKFGTDHISYQGRFHLYREWYKKRPECFWVMTYREKIVGYICMLPLNNDDHFRGRGLVSEFEIPAGSIVQDLSQNILFQGAHLTSRYYTQNKAMDVYVDGIYRTAALFIKNDQRFLSDTRIYGECLIDANAEVFESLGFMLVKDRQNQGRKIYEISFSENDENRKNTRWVQATRRIGDYVLNSI